MASELEIKERQQKLLGILLRLKRVNAEKNQTIYGLDEELEHAMLGMGEEDIALVEKLIGIKVK